MEPIETVFQKPSVRFDYPPSHNKPIENKSETIPKPITPPLEVKPEDWPSKLKETEWLLKYPVEKEEVPDDWQDTVSEEGDPKVTMPNRKESEKSDMTTMPDRKESEELDMTTMPDKKGSYDVDMTTMPTKSAKKDYDYPDISIEGEDTKLVKLFKSIPKD